MQAEKVSDGDQNRRGGVHDATMDRGKEGSENEKKRIRVAVGFLNQFPPDPGARILTGTKSRHPARSE